jgi:pyrroline-5-carboxylate reductase
MDDAEFRAIAKAGRDIGAESFEEARRFVAHTMVGASYLLHERAVDLGRAIRDALPGPLRRLFS